MRKLQLFCIGIVCICVLGLLAGCGYVTTDPSLPDGTYQGTILSHSYKIGFGGYATIFVDVKKVGAVFLNGKDIPIDNEHLDNMFQVVKDGWHIQFTVKNHRVVSWQKN